MSLIPIGGPLAQWDPFNQFGSLYNKFNVLFNGHNGAPTEVQWTPAMDNTPISISFSSLPRPLGYD